MRIAEYEQRAALCARKAEAASNEDSRRLWSKLAAFWRDKAARPKMRTFQGLRHIVSPPTSPRSRP